MSDTIELQGCEHCNEEKNLDLMVRMGDTSAEVAEITKISPNSYGAGYYQGYLDALEELLNVAALPQS